ILEKFNSNIIENNSSSPRASADFFGTRDQALASQTEQSTSPRNGYQFTGTPAHSTVINGSTSLRTETPGGHTDNLLHPQSQSGSPETSTSSIRADRNNSSDSAPGQLYNIDLKQSKNSPATQRSSEQSSYGEKDKDRNNDGRIQKDTAADFRPIVKGPDSNNQNSTGNFENKNSALKTFTSQAIALGSNLERTSNNSTSQVKSLEALKSSESAKAQSFEPRVNAEFSARTLTSISSAKSEQGLNLSFKTAELNSSSSKTDQSLQIKTDNNKSISNLDAVKNMDARSHSLLNAQNPLAAFGPNGQPSKTFEQTARGIRTDQSAATNNNQASQIRLSTELSSSQLKPQSTLTTSDGRLDPSGRPVKGLDLSSGKEISAVNIAVGKRTQEGRYMIAELTLAMVLAAGGIRRILPSDRVSNNSDKSNGNGGDGRRRIERELSGKLREPLSADSMKFQANSFSLQQLKRGFKQDGLDGLKGRLLQVNLQSGRKLMLGTEGAKAFLKATKDTKSANSYTSQDSYNPSSISTAQLQLRPLLAEAAGSAQFAMPAEVSAFEKFFKGQQQALDEALFPLINAASEFIEIDDPFQSFKDMFAAKEKSTGARGATELLDRPQGSSDQNNDNDDEASNKIVMRRPSLLVAEGDTLISIAEEHFSDPYLGWLIADLNKENSKEHWMDGKRIVEFHSRQQITLPVWQDIVDFYGSMPKEAKPENLVTIVSATQVDREVVDSVLGPIVARRAQNLSEADAPKQESAANAADSKEAVLL
ncbi:MAG: hypothetical protein K2X27_11720, partial [Candidatus Obscuribacterales bacterium]|nr:hypothetical protein [Candidatus Obscuribacterales bacterium]